MARFGRRDFAISPRSRCNISPRICRPRFPYLAAISARSRPISARSRRVFGRRDFPHLGVISPRFSPRSRRDRGEISARSLKTFHKGTTFNNINSFFSYYNLGASYMNQTPSVSQAGSVNREDSAWSTRFFISRVTPGPVKTINWEIFSLTGNTCWDPVHPGWDLSK